MADFVTAYTKYIKPIEGGYANVAADKGGETYGGIARNYWPSWSGWAVIDAQKAKGAIKKNTKFAALDAPVQAFYQNMWTTNRFGEFTNQDVANIVFDWFVNSGSNAFNTKAIETYGLDEILATTFNKNVPVDSKNDTATIQAANGVNAKALLAEIVKRRKDYYEYLVKVDPSQATFLQGWLKRLAAFQFPTGKVIGIVVGCTFLFFLGVYLVKKDKVSIT